MRKTLLFLPLAALAVLGTSCDDDDHGCDPAPACTSGTVLGHTCSVGTLVQLHNARGGQTIRYDNGSGLRTYDHVIATYSDLGSFDATGSTFYFTYRKGGAGTPPEVQCLAYDAPADLKPYTLTNLAASGCDEVHTQAGN